MKGKVLSIKVRLDSFATFTRAHTFDDHINHFDSIYHQSKDLFDAFYKKPMKIRLIGVRVSNFKELYEAGWNMFLSSDRKDGSTILVFRKTDYGI